MTLSQDDVVIAVMGNTGTGKSSFIKLVTGDPSIKIGNSLESETFEVKSYRFRDPTSGRIVRMVDTPGFDDSREGVTDTEILKRVANFLVEEYDADRKLNGLIYLQRISDNKFTGQSGRNLRMFKNLCGTETYKNVVVLTTFWDRVSNEEGVEREEELRSRFFKDLVDGGTRFMRFNRTMDSANKVLGHILTLAPTNVQIQEEIRVDGKSLGETAAGSERRQEAERMISKHTEEIAELKAEIKTIKQISDAARRTIEEERDKLLKEVERLRSETSELEKRLDDRERLEKELAKEKERREKEIAEGKERRERVAKERREKEAAKEKEKSDSEWSCTVQ
ncbi:P-loop containing nucleoside triphosphate hydrolase protein [Mycena rebaudengoi]|nr:P-loop containing nucleoside triphosphate hydrolase protein [Mycena rebaudengoi]